jgi:AcrR family transcriptional regulator
MNTRDKILRHATKLFAKEGLPGVSMRHLAADTKISPSVIYHYFENKDVLLKELFDHLSNELGRERRLLAQPDTAGEMLKERIAFQLDHAEAVVAILKFYFAYRKTFAKVHLGYVPETAYRHIKEVLEYGVKTGEFIPMEIDEEAKVITHAINGFLLEYYPETPTLKERTQMIESIYRFIIRSLATKKV